MRRCVVCFVAVAGILGNLVGCGGGERAGREENTAGEVAVRTIPAMTALVLPMRGSYAQHEEAFGKLFSYLEQKGLSWQGVPFGVYYDDPRSVPEDSLRWKIGVPVAPGTEAEPPFMLEEFPETKAAVTVCTGPYEGTAPCHAKVIRWIQQQGYTIAGPAMEFFDSDPKQTPPEKLHCRIVYPIRES